MKQFQYTITDSVGLHARPAGQLAKLAKTLDSTVTVQKANGKSADATRTMSIMGMGVKCGDTVTVLVEGGNEDANFQTVEQFFRDNL